MSMREQAFRTLTTRIAAVMTALQRGLPALIAGLFLAALPAYSQFGSAIEGTVTDASGALIPNVEVTLTKIDTGVTQTAHTNATGFYRFSNLPPAGYKVQAALTGLQTTIKDKIELVANRVQDVSLSMQMATATTNVEVTSSAPILQTDAPAVTGTIDRRSIEELPLQGRNVLNAISQTPGVTGRGAMGNANLDIFTNDQFPAIVANGQPTSGNMVFLDGTSLNDSPSSGAVKVIPNPDSIQEMVVSTTDYSAEFGKGSGVVAHLVSRSGTNSLHGSLFEYHRDNDLTARTEFQNAPNPATGRILPVFRRNEFGGSLGGPILKGKTFFFVTWDQLRSTIANAYLTTVETPDFVNFMTANYPNNLSTSLLKQYPAAVGSLGSIQTVADLSPGCTGVGPLGMPCALPIVGTATHSYSSPDNGLQWNLRIDQAFSRGDRIYGNVYRTTQTGVNDNARPTWKVTVPNNAIFGGVNWVHVFSPNLLNEAAVGGTKQDAFIPCATCSVPPISVVGITGFGEGFAPAGFAEADMHWREMLSLTHGRHTLRGGVEVFHNQDFAKFTQTDVRPNYTFLSVFDFASDAPEFQSVNFDPRTGGIQNGNKYWLSSDYGTFIQDDWKARPNLSLNMGLRWEFPSNPSESHGNRGDLTLGQGSSLQQKITNAYVVQARNAYTTERIAYFAPRFGFVWQPSGLHEVSIRSGFGIFFNRGGNTIWSDTALSNPPIGAAITASTLVPTGPQPVFGLCQSNAFPYNCSFPPLPIGLNSRGGSIAGQSDVGGPDLALRQAYSENWFLGLQKSFGSNWVIEGDYLGANGIHLYSVINRNRFAGDRVLNNGNITRLNPFFGAINYADNSNHSSYNGAAFSVQKHLSRGLSFQASYTLGKGFDLMGGAPGCNKCSENDQVVDAYNLAAQRGLSEGDISKQLSFNAVWQIPSSREWGALSRAALGWQISSLAVLSSGTPQSVYTSTGDYNGDGTFYDYPNAPAFGHGKSGFKRSDYLNGALKATDFPSPCPTSAPCGIQGNLGRDTFRGPGFAQVDMAGAKNFTVPWVFRDTAQLQFRAELFNVFNRVNLSGWDTNLSDGLFGKATGTSQARTTQLSLRIAF